MIFTEHQCCILKIQYSRNIVAPKETQIWPEWTHFLCQLPCMPSLRHFCQIYFYLFVCPFLDILHTSQNQHWGLLLRIHFTFLSNQFCYAHLIFLFQHIIVMTMMHFRHLWLRPMTSPSATEVRNHLVEIFRLFGAPQILLIDNGTYFRGAVEASCKELNVQLRHGRVIHPQTTGKVKYYLIHIFVNICVRFENSKGSFMCVCLKINCHKWDFRRLLLELIFLVLWTEGP